MAVMDLVTSIIAGFVIFTTFGALAKKTGLEVSEVARGGYGLAFVAYPEALSNLPLPQWWSVLFFFMLFTLGLDSETGDYIVGLMDSYGADFSVLCVATCECVSVLWVYGVTRFIKDIEFMLGKTPAPTTYWLFCWVLASPLLIGGLFAYRLIEYVPPKVKDGVFFPEFAQIIGWCVTALVLCPIPLYFVYKFIITPWKVTERLRIVTTLAADWGPNTKEKLYNADTQFTDIGKAAYAYDNPASQL